MKKTGSVTEWDVDREENFELRLFVTGTSPLSVRSINNLQVILDEHLKGRYKLEIIDSHQQPLLVESENVSALPMLIKKKPLPAKRLIGDMSDKEKVLRGLGLI